MLGTNMTSPGCPGCWTASDLAIARRRTRARDRFRVLSSRRLLVPGSRTARRARRPRRPPGSVRSLCGRRRERRVVVVRYPVTACAQHGGGVRGQARGTLRRTRPGGAIPPKASRISAGASRLVRPARTRRPPSPRHRLHACATGQYVVIVMPASRSSPPAPGAVHRRDATRRRRFRPGSKRRPPGARDRRDLNVLRPAPGCGPVCTRACR